MEQVGVFLLPCITKSSSLCKIIFIQFDMNYCYVIIFKGIFSGSTVEASARMKKEISKQFQFFSIVFVLAASVALHSSDLLKSCSANNYPL